MILINCRRRSQIAKGALPGGMRVVIDQGHWWIRAEYRDFWSAEARASGENGPAKLLAKSTATEANGIL